MNDGILIVNKPQWYTSFDVVAKARKALNTKKIGHTGTLDPMATGVLVLCVNKATNLVDVLTCEDKVYKTTIRLGIQTDTADMAGQIINYDNPVIITAEPNIANQSVQIGKDEPEIKRHLSDASKEQYDFNILVSNDFSFDFSQPQIEEVLKSFVGVSEQIPPMYSSIKVNGKKLYEYARKGESVEIPPRQIEIFNIYDISWNGKSEITYIVHCSKGTYIRALNEDIAKKLGTVGTTMALERIKTGQFSIEQATSIEVSYDKIISLEDLFSDKIELNNEDIQKLLNGIEIDKGLKDGYYNIYNNDKYIGLGTLKNGKLKRFIIV